LIDRVWQTDWVGDTRTLDVHIRWLREKSKKIQASRGTSKLCAVWAIALRRRARFKCNAFPVCALDCCSRIWRSSRSVWVCWHGALASSLDASRMSETRAPSRRARGSCGERDGDWLNNYREGDINGKRCSKRPAHSHSRSVNQWLVLDLDGSVVDRRGTP